MSSAVPGFVFSSWILAGCYPVRDSFAREFGFNAEQTIGGDPALMNNSQG
jgi:hypothetical protein